MGEGRSWPLTRGTGNDNVIEEKDDILGDGMSK